MDYQHTVQDPRLSGHTPETLQCTYSDDFPILLTQLGISLAISTYQAGKVILVWAESEVIKTRCHPFQKPMGIAVQQGQLTVGDQNTIWFYQNDPDSIPHIETEDDVSAFYLPRHSHVTGDINIHEMAWGHHDLWIVNTKYSTLYTLDSAQHYTPHWRPNFVTALSPEDRCHLNGLAMVNGLPKYVTALGETDTAGGWRDNKRDGGILMDVETNQVLARGLSMPHSPRLYGDKLWVLESGNGKLGWFDPSGLAHGKQAYQTIETVTQVPGFTRGLDFAGPYAFIGLSQVRESAVFSGIPLVESNQERECGVWVVNIQTGQTVAFLRFESDIQEIFAVQVLSTRFPEMVAWRNHHTQEAGGDSF